jgi:hypothetical protein
MIEDLTPVTKTRSPRVKEGIEHPPAQEAAVQRYLRDSVPDKHRTATDRVLHKRLSPAQAIKQKCLACCNYSREDVIQCGVVTCPLNAYRPYQDKLEAEEDAE